MLLQYSTLVLASQLLIAVADNVPKFDIERGCKATTSASPRAALDDKVCVQNEQQALKQLQSLWSQMASSARSMCMRQATEAGDVITPSYVELLVCLQEQRFVDGGRWRRWH